MKFLLTLIAICASITPKAQTKQGTITYERKANLHRHINDEQMKAMIPEFQTADYELSFKDSISVYKAAPKDEAPDPFDGGIGGNHITIKIGGPGDVGVVYRNFSSDKLLEQTSLEEKKYIINDTIKQLPWKLVDETKTILNHVCKKATLTPEKGAPVTAWYAEDIPVATGPDRFSGLPGVILLVDVDNGFIVFTATDIQPTASTKDLKAPTEGTLVTRAEFSKKMDDVMGPPDAQGRRIMTKTF
jgi:GLPGLI family protein